MQQHIAMQQQQIAHQHLNHVQSSPEEHSLKTSPKKAKKRLPAPKKEKVEKPKKEKLLKVKKERIPKVKEAIPARESSSESEQEEVSPTRRSRQANAENTRHSGRVRGKLVNYNEDEGEEEFIMRTEKRIAPKLLKLRQQQQQQQLQQAPEAPSSMSVESQQLQNISDASSSPAISHPPIVLRISKVISD